ncbi:MAG: DUF3040 domain-containing protein [Pseudonocardiales bacterium]|nr:DUF3040 domain-containing protein [Pseudonocardiales bacterium]
MNSRRDRLVLEGIERDLRAMDPELCDRLSRVEDEIGPLRSALRRSIGTRAIVGYLAVLFVALLLGLTGLVFLMFVATVVSVSARAVRARPDMSEVPPGMPPYGMPPFGMR